MALTPEDVVNKRFQPTKFREGYDQDEVDDFLDEVVVELRRLNQENVQLRQRLVADESRISEQQRSAGQGGQEPVQQPQYAAVPATIAEPVPVQEPIAVAEPVAAPPVVVPFPAPVVPSAAEQEAIDNGNTNNLLQLARKLHEEHVREGVEKRDSLIAEGHATAARVISDAETTQRAQVAVLDAEKAALEREKSTLEQKVDELRTFEREYRLKLKGYIEGQLKELDDSEPSSSAPVAQAPVSPTPDSRENYPSMNEPRESIQAAPPVSFQGFGGN